MQEVLDQSSNLRLSNSVDIALSPLSFGSSAAFTVHNVEERLWPAQLARDNVNDRHSEREHVRLGGFLGTVKQGLGRSVVGRRTDSRQRKGCGASRAQLQDASLAKVADPTDAIEADQRE